ncbi:MAG: preprotein translocase subunit SecE [Actinobacteria bacterium]|nr:preprotein translocase subunit SecE [Actinomycetota bacterium]MDA8186246.1 preprotein translocase subunit SecE [Actinomycetota bacterium]
MSEFVREIRSELRQVAWPTRSEVVNSTVVVLITLVLLIALIFVLNYAFAKGAAFLFTP